MCWISEKLDKKVAEHDITVYKIVLPCTRGTKSLFYKFWYLFNVTYRGTLAIKLVGSEYCITEGFHSYKTKSQVLFANQFYFKKIVKCVLPKGAIYYVNNLDEVVSNQIRIISYEKI